MMQRFRNASGFDYSTRDAVAITYAFCFFPRCWDIKERQDQADELITNTNSRICLLFNTLVFRILPCNRHSSTPHILDHLNIRGEAMNFLREYPIYSHSVSFSVSFTPVIRFGRYIFLLPKCDCRPTIISIQSTSKIYNGFVQLSCTWLNLTFYSSK